MALDDLLIEAEGAGKSLPIAVTSTSPSLLPSAEAAAVLSESHVSVHCPHAVSNARCLWRNVAGGGGCVKEEGSAGHVLLELKQECLIESLQLKRTGKQRLETLKEFKVFGGLHPEALVELLHAGASEDSSEVFKIDGMYHGIPVPCKYVCIVQLKASSNCNITAWTWEVRGETDEAAVQAAKAKYLQWREDSATRYMLKHLRQRNYAAFLALQSHTKGVLLEDPLLTQLHSQIVLEGNTLGAEGTLRVALSQGCFRETVMGTPYRPVWTRLLPPSKKKPGVRGGHQMCIDPETGKLYLLGGWDGTRDLADFWEFDIAGARWQLLSSDTSAQGGPGPVSCHKVCLDAKNKKFYTFGRYLDGDHRQEADLRPSFFCYDLVLGRWHCLSPDTAAEGGPGLVYDHAMCLDVARQLVYVFGGRRLGGPSQGGEGLYSGLYVYDISGASWRLLRCDEEAVEGGGAVLTSRLGHSMLLDPTSRVLYVFAGQRGKDYLSDFYAYDIEEDYVRLLSTDSSRQGGPDAGFTQRSTIDPEAGELFVLSGLVREKNSAKETAKNSLWVYSLAKQAWQTAYANEHTPADVDYWLRMKDVEPCPRYAHQLVYDPRQKVHYLFGGNPGAGNGSRKERLDDFWSLKLERPSEEELFRGALFLLRAQHFRELAHGGTSVQGGGLSSEGSSLDALVYLRRQVAECVDHSVPEEEQAFRKLAAELFVAKPDSHQLFQQRTALFERISQIFPEGMRQPPGNLVDLV